MAKREDDPCWENYEQLGMKMKDGEKVPNCVKSGESDHSEVGVTVPEGWSVASNS